MASNIILLVPLVIFCCLISNSSQDAPTLYELYTGDGIQSGLNANQSFFLLNDKEIQILSGTFHYFRVHQGSWRDRLRKMRAAGLNTVETYVPWNLHEPQSGIYDFGGENSEYPELLDIVAFLKMVQEEDMFALVRSGPYICAEWEFGGLPSWLLRESEIKMRTSDPTWLKYVERYFKVLFSKIVDLQFTKGGPIIALQIENEYGNTGNSDPDYLHSLKQIFLDNGIVELLYTSDPPSAGTRGALPNEVLMTANFGSNAKWNLQTLNTLQTNKPTMAMEFWTGWYDKFGDNHAGNDPDNFKSLYEEILSFPASVNQYIFVGSTNFGFTNGANDNTGGTDNSGLTPITTSYDYVAPISEAGALTEKYTIVKDLNARYTLVTTLLPDVPEVVNPVALDEIKIEEQILLSEIIDDFPNKIESENVMAMELLDINNNSGQSQGYIVYRKTNLDIPAGAVLKIADYVRDVVLVLVNGKLVSPVLSSKNDLNSFGFWRLKDSTLTLTTEDIKGATLDLVVGNMGRNNYGSLDQFQQFKGLINDVYLNNDALKNWQIVPLEFKRSWNKNLNNWHAIKNQTATPALYRAKFTVSAPLKDTFIDVQEWNQGIAIVNGFVLGRIFSVGPQMALYVPSGLLNEGQNELVIFEHFTAPDSVKFSSEPIWGVGKNLK